MIRPLEIKNYKSIKQLQMDCSRINVLIGEPNVGKSNILEALDLTYLSFYFHANKNNAENGKETIQLKKYFRVDKVSDLFYNGNIQEPIEIAYPGFSNKITLRFIHEAENGIVKKPRNCFEIYAGAGFTLFDNEFTPFADSKYFGSPIDSYRFKSDIEYHDVGNYLNMLMPPFGNNLMQVIKHNPSFRKFIGELLKDTEDIINIDTSDPDPDKHRILLQKKENENLIFSLKYEALADTLRRVIFYSAAIRHSGGEVITLEEPDTHSFPKFVSFLADEIIEAKSKQFFIATHNPYLLNRLIEGTPANELAVFVCGYNKEKGTFVKKLTEEDLSELLDYGVDIFFNINRYLDNNVAHSA